MRLFEPINRAIVKALIRDYQDTDNKRTKIRYGLLAGWLSIIVTLGLFVVKMVLGILAGSVSIVANAFHLLSHLVSWVIVVFSFWLTARPATSKTPFGHGRMEQVAPLIMSVLLFVAGIQIGERAVHQVVEPHHVHYWTALPWILLATIIVKQWMAQFVQYLGTQVDSHAILATAAHHRIDVGLTLTVIGGLVAGHYFHHPEIDGYIGILASLWLFYQGYHHGREAIIPILGQAPSKAMLAKIRDTAKSVNGVEDVHEIIVHDYGSMYMITLHAEIPERFTTDQMHQIAEQCEARLRKQYGGEVVCHTDPLMEHTPETRALEDVFSEVIAEHPRITAYHDFRIIADSPETIIIVADVDCKENIPEKEYDEIASDLQAHVKEAISKVSYCSFYVSPKFAY
jgi:cation diffusion facilitator family transporter